MAKKKKKASKSVMVSRARHGMFNLTRAIHKWYPFLPVNWDKIDIHFSEFVMVKK